MEAEDVIQLPNCGSDSGSEGDEACKLNRDDDGVEGPMGNGESNLGRIKDDPELEQGQLMSELEITGDVDFVETAEIRVLDYVALSVETGRINDFEVEEGHVTPETESGKNVGEETTEFTENVAQVEGKIGDVPSENGCVAEREAQTSSSCLKTDGGSISGVKRTRATSEDEQPSVHVKYYGLSRHSKRKLEQLLREWSQWSARTGSRLQDQDEASESGEDIYFPALDVGMGKTSTVSFWMENEVKKPQDKDSVPMEDDSVPLYDRGFAWGLTTAEGSSNREGYKHPIGVECGSTYCDQPPPGPPRWEQPGVWGMEPVEAPRCFNCTSYGHSLRDCPKPRDIAAVNNSRKQLKSKRNQTAGARNPTRYYQDTPGGKYEGLRPGILSAETRRLLGLAESDPPPWLTRMREIGYPPGYLDPDDENLPSGIAIFGDEDIKEDKEEGEILEAEATDLPHKMSINIPGINAPIPENADERLWASRSSNSERHRNGDSGRSTHYSESSSRSRHREHGNRDFKDDDPHSYDRGSRRSPSFQRSVGEKERNDSDDSAAFGLYSSFSYNSTTPSNRRFSDSLDANRDDYSSRSTDRHRHRSGR